MQVRYVAVYLISNNVENDIFKYRHPDACNSFIF